MPFSVEIRFNSFIFRCFFVYCSHVSISSSQNFSRFQIFCCVRIQILIETTNVRAIEFEMYVQKSNHHRIHRPNRTNLNWNFFNGHMSSIQHRYHSILKYSKQFTCMHLHLGMWQVSVINFQLCTPCEGGCWCWCECEVTHLDTTMYTLLD